jgi:hypothetical protein
LGSEIVWSLAHSKFEFEFELSFAFSGRSRPRDPLRQPRRS